MVERLEKHANIFSEEILAVRSLRRSPPHSLLVQQPDEKGKSSSEPLYEKGSHVPFRQFIRELCRDKDLYTSQFDKAMEHEERISTIEMAQGISMPNYQQKRAPLVAAAKYQMETYTCAIEKTFTKIITNYCEETIIPL